MARSTQTTVVSSFLIGRNIENSLELKTSRPGMISRSASVGEVNCYGMTTIPTTVYDVRLKLIFQWYDSQTKTFGNVSANVICNQIDYKTSCLSWKKHTKCHWLWSDGSRYLYLWMKILNQWDAGIIYLRAQFTKWSNDQDFFLPSEKNSSGDYGKNPGKIWEACHGNLVCLGAEDRNFSRNLLELGHTKRERLQSCSLHSNECGLLQRLRFYSCQLKVLASGKWQETGN